MIDLIDLALREDIGDGDVTSQYFTDATRQSVARISAKEPCVAAGTQTAAEVFRRVDPSLEVRVLVSDGDRLQVGDTAIEISGSTRGLLTAERVALNFLQRLSGVATLTRRYVDAVAGTGCRILDTRKTTPGFRALEKAAVASGGGTNHRIGLYDRVMVKDNHLAGGLDPDTLAERVARVREERPDVRIEIEADTLEQAAAFFQIPGVDIVLLDNMPLDVMREAVRRRPQGIKLEASGGITLATVRQVAETGVDFVSVGALTHSAIAVDYSLELLRDL
ncbi:MAG: carboxylating nicotinate-nucleotide diphosphorylase [Chthoniobacterales bacterium]